MQCTFFYWQTRIQANYTAIVFVIKSIFSIIIEQIILESVRIAVGRPGVHSLGRVIPKDFEKWYSQLPAWRSAQKKG